VKRLAEGVWQLTGFPAHGINEYLLEDVLVDAGARFNRRQILRNLRGHRLSAHALTHAHPDHQGASRSVCEQFGVPFWVGERDADAAEQPELIRERQPDVLINKVFWKAMAGPGRPVDRRLAEGDEVAGFEVLEVPGHSRGHIAFWRASDGVLVLGDVLNNQNPLTGVPRGLRLPFDFFTPDPQENLRSAKRLGELEPKLVLFGHGPPLRDTRRFVEFVRALPAP
jgi:glyoxylase-like metal-dependent hydrolase (beta-lactamase superfamily II)